jgi:SAM-dependent methyltransferase
LFSRSADIYDAVYSYKDYVAEAEHVHALIEERTPGASTLLDVACGTGKHLEQFARWYSVQGLDLNEDLVAIARDRLGDRAHIHLADMTSFDFSRTFGAVTCLFSSIGYVGTEERLDAALAAMARHLEPGGTLVLEPWITPEKWIVGRPYLLTVDEPDRKIARASIAGREGDISTLLFDYLVSTPEGTRHFTELHEAALFTDEQYRRAFERAGLSVELDGEGLIGRGLYVGQAS